MKPQFLLSVIAPLLLTPSMFAKETVKAKVIDPKATAILEKSIAALGGREAIEKIKTTRAKGTVEIPAQGMTSELTIIQKAPNKIFSKMKLGDIMTIEQGYDGKEGWAKDSIQGLRKLAGAELAQIKESSYLCVELYTLNNLASAKVLPEVKEGDTTYHVIEVELKEGTPKTFFFDASTHLLAKINASLVVGPDGTMKMESTVTDYKKFHGVLYPMTAHLTTGPVKMTLKVTEVSHNEEVDDAIFKMKK